MKGKRRCLGDRDLILWDQLYDRCRPRGSGVLLFEPDHVVIDLPPSSDRRLASNRVTLSNFDDDEPYSLSEVHRFFKIRRFFSWVIDLDERGSFRAHVEDAGGSRVFSCSNEDSEYEDGELWLIADGFMRHKEDTDGLEGYLRSVGAIGENDRVLSDCRFREYIRGLEDRYRQRPRRDSNTIGGCPAVL